ncbi:GNAT family N-acetyltransferase [Brachybacterium sp. AOP25-B2-12]|uniref:GNAT family N-acetyltransferase n=1 Tax=Brachybacterium sp. AOP25-B2-12 TaxID=3457710 RepID=UPI0040349019
MSAAPLPGPGRPLRTARLELSVLDSSDLDALHALHADPRTFALDSTEPVTSRAAMVAVLESWTAARARQGFGYAGIRARAGEPGGTAPASAAGPGPLPPSPLLLGVCGLTTLDLDGHEVVSVYYRLHPEAWGRGIAREALAALLAEADLHLAGREAVVVTDPGNTPSLRLARALGFVPAPRRPRAHPHLALLTRHLGTRSPGLDAEQAHPRAPGTGDAAQAHPRATATGREVPSGTQPAPGEDSR